MAGREDRRDEARGGDRPEPGRPSGSGDGGQRGDEAAAARRPAVLRRPGRSGPQGSPGRSARSGRPGARTGRLPGPSTRRAALLALVVCAVVLSVAVPLRNYLGQRGELDDTVRQQEQLREQVDGLEKRRAELSDPAQVEAEARRRLRYVRPGETPYVVQLPSQTPAPAPAPPAGDTPRADTGGHGYDGAWKPVAAGGGR